MKLREYIAELEALAQAHGDDLEVETYMFDFRRVSAGRPRLAHRLILQGRETKPRFYQRGDKDDRKGEPVMYV